MGAGLLLALLAAGASAAPPACAPLDHEHAAWTRLLARYVDEGVVDYTAFGREAGGELDRYLARLGRACADDAGGWSRPRRLAFWLNAYNASVIQLVLEHWPLESIRSIGWLPNAAFRRTFIDMEGLGRGTMSLDDIEHRTLRADPTLRDARIHFALVCAARSCPPLRSEAYRAAVLESQLDDQARRFLRDPTKNRWDPDTRTLHLSAIFKWFREDFEREAPSLAAAVAPHLPAATAADLRSGEVEVTFLPYDWSINGR